MMTKKRKSKATPAAEAPSFDAIALILRDSYRLLRWDRLSRRAFQAAAIAAEPPRAPRPRQRPKAAAVDLPAPVNCHASADRARVRRAA